MILWLFQALLSLQMGLLNEISWESFSPNIKTSYWPIPDLQGNLSITYAGYPNLVYANFLSSPDEKKGMTMEFMPLLVFRHPAFL